MSYPSPSRFITPGRKFSSTTSADRMSFRAIALPASCCKSIARPLLFRFILVKALAIPPLWGKPRRIKSPPNASTLMTSAPWSASMAPAIGPENIAEKSATRTPCSGPVLGCPRSICVFMCPSPVPQFANLACARVDQALCPQKGLHQRRKRLNLASVSDCLADVEVDTA